MLIHVCMYIHVYIGKVYVYAHNQICIRTYVCVCMFVCLSYMFICLSYMFVCLICVSASMCYMFICLIASIGVLSHPCVAIAVGSAIAKQKQDQNGQKCKGITANGKAKTTNGERKMSKGKGNVIMGPRSLVHEKTPNGGKTKASGKTATGSLPRSKTKGPKLQGPRWGSTTSSIRGRALRSKLIKPGSSANKMGAKPRQEVACYIWIADERCASAESRDQRSEAVII